MRSKAQFVPWRTAVGAAVVSVLALTLAGIAHTVDHAPAEPVTARVDLHK
jgi:hypothetical protein